MKKKKNHDGMEVMWSDFIITIKNNYSQCNIKHSLLSMWSMW